MRPGPLPLGRSEGVPRAPRAQLPSASPAGASREAGDGHYLGTACWDPRERALSCVNGDFLEVRGLGTLSLPSPLVRLRRLRGSPCRAGK